MSDLDKAIRADLAQRARETAPEAADRSMVAYADAIRSVLDLHAHTEVPGLPMRQCAACGLVSRGRWCDTVSAIADDLGVSGEERSEPTPAPREYRAGDIEPPVGTKLSGGGFTWTRHGRSWQTPEGGVLNWAQLNEFCPRLSEVVTPEGTP